MSQPSSLSLDVVVAMDTDVGRRRQQNQDAIGHYRPTDPAILDALGQIFVLADGVGGLAGGDLASQYAVSTIISSYYEQAEGDPSERLARAVAEANNVIYAEGHDREQPGAMATTVVCAVVCGRDLVLASVGDSPAYLLRDDSVRQLTQDHTAGNTPGIVLDEGDPASHKLVRALGGAPSVKVDVIAGPVRPGDVIVLCSDGLTRYLSPDEIADLVTQQSPQAAVRALIDTANERGGADNISAIVLSLNEEDDLLALASTNPMDAWGHARSRERVRRRLSTEDTEPVDPETLALVREQVFQQEPVVTPHVRARESDLDVVDENPLYDLWDIIRNNAMLAAAGALILLLIVVVLALIVTNIGDEDSSAPVSNAGAGASLLSTPQTESPPSPTVTLTPEPGVSATIDVDAMATNEALEAAMAAEEATAAILTLTPPPPSGPQMVKDDWFRLQPGEPVVAFDAPDVNAETVTPLEPGGSYLIQEVNSDAWNGPWYYVVDNQGSEARWVNGPSLHRRVLRIADTGEPLPDDQQPTDLPPAVFTPTLRPTITPSGADAEALGLPGEASTSAVEYAPENWQSGTIVFVKEDLLLRITPSLTGTEGDGVSANEQAAVMQGPLAADGHWWWRLRFEGGRVGWVAQPLVSFAPVE